jgi:hypothetical protein
MKNPLASRILLIISIIILALSSCDQGESTPEGATLVPATAPVGDGVTPEVTLPPETLVFLAGIDADPALAAQIEPIVVKFAADAGYAYERRDILGADSAPQNTRFVVALGPAPTLGDLLPVMPEVQFVVIGVDGLPLTANLTMLLSGGNENYSQAFMAGYIAAMFDDEFRVGIISLGDEEGRRYRDSFLNGAVYFCGFCNPIYPPYWEYPLFFEVPPGAAPEVWQQAAEDLITKSVGAIHVAPGVGDERLDVYLAGRGLMIVGTSTPAEGAKANWIASVEMDLVSGFEQVLWDVFQGGALGEVPLSLEITHVNSEYFSEGRLAHSAGVIGQLENGMIDPLGE